MTYSTRRAPIRWCSGVCGSCVGGPDDVKRTLYDVLYRERFGSVSGAFRERFGSHLSSGCSGSLLLLIAVTSGA